MPEYDPAAVAKFLTADNRAMLESVIRHLEARPSFTGEAVEEAIQAVMAETGLKMGKVAQPVRVAVTGGVVSPGIGETLFLLGKEETLKRLDRTLATFQVV